MAGFLSISVGSVIFAYEFLNLGDDGFKCDLESVDKSTYDTVVSLKP